MEYKTFQGQSLVNFFSEKPFPTIKGWNRLEGRPRTANFDRSLRAEVHDPLWMLTRQWQMGEFRGDDAGSPVMAKVKVATTRIDRYRSRDNPPQAYDESIPLETRVEREAVSLAPISSEIQLPRNLTLSLQIARQWFRLLDRAGLSRDYRADFRQAFAIVMPPADETGAAIYAHEPVWQAYAAVAGRAMDGSALLRTASTGGDILADVTPDSPADTAALRDTETRLVAWFQRLYSQADANDSAWAPSYLEYQFSASAPDYDGRGQIVLLADEYHGGHLDWHSFDLHPDVKTIARPDRDLPFVRTARPQRAFDFIPASIEFGGMPNVRWWEFENRKTHFGDIDADTTDLAKLLLIEFGLIYSNDWFLLPFEVPVGTLARVEGLAVTNVFGERIWIDAAGAGDDDDWQKWSMYNLNVRGAQRQADRSIFIPPAIDRLHESAPVEAVHFVRDEMANMVWAVESRLPLASGAVSDGYERATELTSYLTQLVPPTAIGTETPNNAEIRYQLMNQVPENWIPFVPVRMPEALADNREVQIQRAAMLRSLPGSPDRPKIRPQTELLRYNLDGAYFIHEEEVPRAGSHVLRTWQRGRWHDGKVCLWLGRRKRTGRGEGSSGLAFDQIENVTQNGEPPG